MIALHVVSVMLFPPGTTHQMTSLCLEFICYVFVKRDRCFFYYYERQSIKVLNESLELKATFYLFQSSWI